MIRCRKGAFPALAIVAAVSTVAATKPTETSDAEGQALAAELRASRPEQDLLVEGMMLVRHGNGKRTRMPFRHQIIVEPRNWRSIYATLGPGQTPEELVVVHAENQPNQYLFTKQTGTNAPRPEPASLGGPQAMVPFANSDFWLADLGLEFLHWPEQRIVEEARIKMRKSRPCKVLESRNPRPGASGYTRVRSWVDAEQRGIIIAEAYGPDGKLMKEFEVGGLTKINGRWELKNLEMRDLRTDSRTVLEFRYERNSSD